MNGKRTPGRSLDEWLELVISCRQSGLTDAAWCHENGISPSCFTMLSAGFAKKPVRYQNHLEKQALFTSHKQDVVQMSIPMQ